MAAEFDIIARHFAPIAGPTGLGLLDDAALLKPPHGHDLVVTTDALVAGIHFFADDPPESIGHKSLAVNLSDLAAKGAAPLGFVLSLMLPHGLSEGWLAAFAKGLGDLAGKSCCPLVGGDTVITKQPLTLSITAFGAVPHGRMVKRGSAQQGDRLFVTGTIGDAAIGLQERSLQRMGKPSVLAADHAAYLIERYLRPRPRHAIAAILQEHAHAAMDVSDGLIGDLNKMITLSGYGADIQLHHIPHSVAARAALRADPTLCETALIGGDDYEVLAAVPTGKANAFQAACLDKGVTVTAIGAVGETGQLIRFLDANGEQMRFHKPSYVHGDVI